MHLADQRSARPIVLARDMLAPLNHHAHRSKSNEAECIEKARTKKNAHTPNTDDVSIRFYRTKESVLPFPKCKNILILAFAAYT